MPASMKSFLVPPVSPSIADEVAYISGVNGSGKVPAISSHNWNGDTPATYGNTSSASKLGTSLTPGTPGGLQLYYFNPAANWSPAEKAALASGLTLWSAVANIQFAETTDPSKASLDFRRAAVGDGTFETNPNRGAPVAIGSTVLSSPGPGAYLQVDTNDFTNLGDFNVDGGANVGVILHEEGHYLGLGHSGPYNGSNDPGTQQFSAYDSHQYTLMSYIASDDPAGKYAASYPLGASANPVGDSTTWMPLDILAVQSLYGAPVNSPLSGGQVFGFNTNIQGALRPYFDFTTINKPFMTLFDTGGNNTLDLSGYSTASTVDLRPGSYSSVNGMTYNLAIAYNTAIDKAIGGAGNDSFTVNSNADTINGGGGTNVVRFSGVLANYNLAQANNLVTVTSKITGIVDSLTNIQTLAFADTTVQTSTIGAGLNVINGPAKGFAVIKGTAGNDQITAFGRGNAIFANGGNDVIKAGDGVAAVDLAGGNVNVTLGGSLNVVGGGNGNNTVTGAPGGATAVTLGNGVNTVQVGGTRDIILLGNGGNTVSGTQGMAFITTGSGNDKITLGGSGNTVNAGAGTNTIIGGTGTDKFVLAGASKGFDLISMFTESNGDVLDLKAALAATSWNRNAASLGNFLKVTNGGGNTFLAIANGGSGSGVQVAQLSGVTYGLADLQSHHSLLTA